MVANDPVLSTCCQEPLTRESGHDTVVSMGLGLTTPVSLEEGLCAHWRIDVKYQQTLSEIRQANKMLIICNAEIIVPIQSLLLAHTQAHTHTRACTCTLMHAHTHARTHARTHIVVRKCICAFTVNKWLLCVSPILGQNI